MRKTVIIMNEDLKSLVSSDDESNKELERQRKEFDDILNVYYFNIQKYNFIGDCMDFI